MEKDRYGGTALHIACKNEHVTLDIVSKLITLGGKELVMEKNIDGYTALHHGYFNLSRYIYSPSNSRFNDVFSLLVKECILSDVGGEFGIGGLFNAATEQVVQNNTGGEFGIGGLFNVATEQIQLQNNIGGEFGIWGLSNGVLQDKIYKKWDQLSPALRSSIISLQDQQQPPILHAAILAKAPLHVIKNIINHFDYSILKVDSSGRYAIEVALEEGLCCSEGLQEIVKATSMGTVTSPKDYTFSCPLWTKMDSSYEGAC